MPVYTLYMSKDFILMALKLYSNDEVVKALILAGLLYAACASHHYFLISAIPAAIVIHFVYGESR